MCWKAWRCQMEPSGNDGALTLWGVPHQSHEPQATSHHAAVEHVEVSGGTEK